MSDMLPLTQKQAAVLAFIVAHQAQHQRPPTRQEIAKNFGWSSINAADEHVRRLAKKGAIVLDKLVKPLMPQAKRVKVDGLK